MLNQRVILVFYVLLVRGGAFAFIQILVESGRRIFLGFIASILKEVMQ